LEPQWHVLLRKGTGGVQAPEKICTLAVGIGLVRDGRREQEIDLGLVRRQWGGYQDHWGLGSGMGLHNSRESTKMLR